MMSESQRFRRFFLLSLILWGVIGGLVSLHSCMNEASSYSAYNSSCCCGNKSTPSCINLFSKKDCCKTITSYVGLPLYYLVQHNLICSLSSISLMIMGDDSASFECHAFTILSVHPPPENELQKGIAKRILAMRI